MRFMKRICAIFSVCLLLINPILVFATSGSTTVYITEYGKKYHRGGCRYLKDSCYETTLQEAVSLGLEPCAVCNPPLLDGGTRSITPVPSSPTSQTPTQQLTTPTQANPKPEQKPSTIVEKPSYYTDLYPSSYYYKSVVNLSDKGVIGGFPDGSFKPNQTVTRAQLAVMLVNANNKSTSTGIGAYFTDVPRSHWAYSFISAASNAGYLSGYPDGSFKPENQVSYNEALTMIVASLGYTMKDLTGTYPKCFTDKAKEVGVLNTCSKIGTGSVTRAEVSCFLSDSFSAKKNSSTEEYTLGQYTFSIPKTWKYDDSISNGIQRSATVGGNYSLLQITRNLETDNNYPVSFDGLMADNSSMIKAIEATTFDKVTDYITVAGKAAKGILYSGTIKGDGFTGQGWWYVFPSPGERAWYNVICLQTNDTSYSYYDDFFKMINYIKTKY